MCVALAVLGVALNCGAAMPLAEWHDDDEATNLNSYPSAIGHE
jgi:hypothetical protein